MNDVARLARGVILTGVTEMPGDEQLGFAGYLLFARNAASASQMRAFTDALRERSGGKPPILAIDQEGGRVARLQDGIERIPSMMALGACGDLELAQRAGEQTAFDLRRAGCTLDLAPVLDLALDPNNTVIGTRSFGSDPQRVAALGAAFARGLQNGGITPCYKHFPGHGSTATDSHEALPVVQADEATLLARDVAPFAAVARDAPAMMSGHLLVRAFDAQHPATLSRAISTELLRERLGFGGALLTDCLEMEAVAAHEPDLAAGADLLLFSHHVDLALRAAAQIEAAVADGRLSLERLEEAHARVARLRDAAQPPLPLDAFPPHPNVGREIARRAITVVRGIPEASPLASIAVSFGGAIGALAREAPALQTLETPLDPAPQDLATLRDALDRSQRRPILLARRANVYRRQADAIGAILEDYRDAVIVSLLEPFDLPLFGAARHLLAAYGDDAPSLRGLADVLFGASLPSGRLPVTLP